MEQARVIERQRDRERESDRETLSDRERDVFKAAHCYGAVCCRVTLF